MKSWQKYQVTCAKNNIPVKLRHWAWNMQKPGMINYLRKVLPKKGGKLNSVCIAFQCYHGIKL